MENKRAYLQHLNHEYMHISCQSLSQTKAIGTIVILKNTVSFFSSGNSLQNPKCAVSLQACCFITASL